MHHRFGNCAFTSNEKYFKGHFSLLSSYHLTCNFFRCSSRRCTKVGKIRKHDFARLGVFHNAATWILTGFFLKNLALMIQIVLQEIMIWRLVEWRALIFLIYFWAQFLFEYCLRANASMWKAKWCRRWKWLSELHFKE